MAEEEKRYRIETWNPRSGVYEIYGFVSAKSPEEVRDVYESRRRRLGHEPDEQTETKPRLYVIAHERMPGSTYWQIHAPEEIPWPAKE